MRSTEITVASSERSSTAVDRGLGPSGAPMRPDHEYDSDGDHRQRQPLPHREPERQRPEKVVGFSGVFHEESKASIADEKQPRHGADGVSSPGVDPQQKK